MTVLASVSAMSHFDKNASLHNYNSKIRSSDCRHSNYYNRYFNHFYTFGYLSSPVTKIDKQTTEPAAGGNMSSAGGNMTS
jgi:hypothetical protein